MEVYAIIALLLLACASEDSGVDSALGSDTGAGDTGAQQEADLEDLFSYVVIADPHVVGEGDHADNLRMAVRWVNDNAAAEQIELVLVVGDIAWGDDYALGVSLVGELAVPWVPVMGDNEIQGGTEEAMYTAFAEQRAALAQTFDGWAESPAPVALDGEVGAQAWLTNYAFDHRGLRFVVLDWCSRDIGTIYGEMADLYDFDGGTLPWFADQLGALADGPDERVVMASHHPMHMSPGAFDTNEIDTLYALTTQYADQLSHDQAGHYHVTGDEPDEGAGYEVHVTAAVHNVEAPIRIVRVSGNGARFAFEQEIIELK